MDINQMVEKNIPIYVVNRSARVLGKAHVLVLEFPHPTGGRSSTVKIPPIKHPINLTRRVAPPQAIPLSTAFIDWVNKGVIEIMPAEQAKEILSDPEVRASVTYAYKKLDARRGEALNPRPQFSVRSGGARETHAVADLSEARLSMSDFQSNVPPGMELPQPKPQGVLTVTAETVEIAPKIRQYCVDLQEDPSLKRDYLLELKGWDEVTLSDDDVGYMLSQLREFDNICAYLRSIKAARAGTEDATPVAKVKKGGKGSRARRKTPVMLDEDDL